MTEDADFADAKRAFDDYEQQRSVRAEYAAVRCTATAETFFSTLRAEPLRVVMTLLAILLALGLVALPVILLRG